MALEKRRSTWGGRRVVRWVGWLTATVAMTAARDASAWLLHEHVATAKASFNGLTADQTERLAAAWDRARRLSPRYCQSSTRQPAKSTEVGSPGAFCVGFPALTGLSADHSCTPADERATVASSFVIPVLEEAEAVESKLRNAVVRNDTARQVDLWHLHHLNLQVADPAYLSRAEVNGAHFQLPRIQKEKLRDYLGRVLKDGETSNAIALYLNYHAAAVALAQKASVGCQWSEHQLVCPGPKPSAIPISLTRYRLRPLPFTFYRTRFLPGTA